jgi:uncharacterized protein
MPNALANESSPYLLQHAENPVDWLPWGQAAFDLASELDRPIFLSVGYSTCHWCHVMERESFEDEDIAALLNDHFVNIKLDREERPDIDQIYMTYLQASTGGGGWPMSIFLTPELTPIYGGTYYPPTDLPGRAGFPRVLGEVAKAWEEDRENLLERGRKMVERLQQHLDADLAPADAPPALDEVISKAYHDFSDRFDYHDAGFGQSPKFPRPSLVTFLHRAHLHYTSSGDEHARDQTLEMARRTLLAMAAGGIHDQIGGGFHRYSVDSYWRVPHFEKMLYDQAQLAVAYLEGHQLTGNKLLAKTATSTLDYVLRDLAAPQGAFFAAEDADSPTPDGNLKEGAFYLWTAAQIDEILGAEIGPIYRFTYGVRRSGNAPPEADENSELQGLNVLYRTAPLSAIAKKFKLSRAELDQFIKDADARLFVARLDRPRPHRDEKIVTAWNGLMISALARCGAGLAIPRFIEAASRCASFILAELWRAPGQLRRSYLNHPSPAPGFAADYACLIQGLLDLYEATLDPRWLQDADALQIELDSRYLDPATSAYFSTDPSDPASVLRVREDHDGAEPSPNSVAALNLIRLGRMLGQPGRIDYATRLLASSSSRLTSAPFAVPLLASALALHASAQRQVVLVGPADQVKPFTLALHGHFDPHRTLLHLSGTPADGFLAGRSHALAAMADGPSPAAYPCLGHSCQPPVQSPQQLLAALYPIS